MTPPDAEKPLSALEVERRCVDDHAGPYATICEDCIAALVAKGRAEGLEAAAACGDAFALRKLREQARALATAPQGEG